MGHKIQANDNPTENPLVTFYVFAFNQEKYIKEAIEGAFSQTYSPLEIVLSDDASSDSTPDIIRGMASQYQGPHKVVVNINDRNLGIGGHVNKAFQISSGDFLVLAAGDDISKPERTELVVKRWIEKSRTPALIYNGADVIDADGSYIEELDTALPHITLSTADIIGYSHRRRLLLMGACTAYAKSVISDLGPLNDDLFVEDIPMTVRASLLGGIECIDKPLVQYRKNVSVWLPRKQRNESFDRHLHRMSHRVLANSQVAKQIMTDVQGSMDDDAILAARKRELSCRFSLDVAESKKFSFSRYFVVSFKTGYWRESLLPVILFGFPRIHRFAFALSQFIRRGH
ncbi:MAG: glycosyltransferase [Proteobacteria bacterium]|nr:glycosyltransferase [Pseudomonadota bacterium]